MDNMISWNWPNWITVVLMVALAYLVLGFGTQLVRGRLGMKRGAPLPTGIAGNGQSQSAQNFSGVFGQSEFATPGAMTQMW